MVTRNLLLLSGFLSRHLSEMARFDRSCKNVTTSASIGSLVEAYFVLIFG